MPITSYTIDPTRVGLAVSLRESIANTDRESGGQRHDTAGTGQPFWTIPVLLVDVDVELAVRVAAADRPQFPAGSPLRLGGAGRVSSFATRSAGQARATLSMKVDSIDLADDVAPDLFGQGDAGLFVVDAGPLVVVGAEVVAPDWRNTSPRLRFTALRTWENGAGDLSGQERWSITTPGNTAPPGVGRMSVVEFVGLKVVPWISGERSSARLDLAAEAVRPVAMSASSNGRGRREPAPVETVASDG